MRDRRHLLTILGLGVAGIAAPRPVRALQEYEPSGAVARAFAACRPDGEQHAALLEAFDQAMAAQAVPAADRARLRSALACPSCGCRLLAALGPLPSPGVRKQP